MERTMWNDVRLDDRFNSVDKRLDDLSSKMDSGFARVDSEISDLRTEVRDLRQLMFMLWGPTMLGVLGMIATALITNG
jgi:tetrahydromethanopterin S-methyltransferase subunit G